MAAAPSRSHKRTRRRAAMSEINMVPFIDVMLVLLTIFMVTAPLITTSTIQLPSVKRASTPAQANEIYTLSIDQNLSYRLRSKAEGELAQSRSLSPLLVHLQKGNRAATPALIIEADKNLRYETVIQAMDSLRAAGVERIALQTVQTVQK